MALYLAPMEGVVDWITRDLMTSIGGIDQCVTEFIRVTDKLLPDKIFLDYCPELLTNSRTRSGTPVHVQLLGGHPEPLAINAIRAVELGACGIDFNFGCPAKTVNRHDGGATLLQYPDRIYHILTAARKAVPPHIPVTAKIRLGFNDPNVCVDNAKAVEAAGANQLAIHCRTKTDMYKPPAFWEWIPKIKEVVKIPIVANGEIWNLQDFIRCRQITGCDDVMIGRGGLANPYLFNQIKSYLAGEAAHDKSWNDVRSILPKFFQMSSDQVSPHFAQARTKQWLSQMARKNTNAASSFDRLKTITVPNQFKEVLFEICT